MENNRFNYTYYAPTEAERREIADIRGQYSKSTEEDGLTRLRRLDARVKNASTLAGLVPGILGCLIFGLGLSAVLVWDLPVLGIVIAVLGAAVMGVAYPLARRADARARERYVPEILRLSDELLGKTEDNREN